TVTCLTCDMPPPVVSANVTTICEGDSVDLSATATLETTYWYAGSCGGTPIDSGATTTVYPTTSSWYFAANEYEGTFSICDSVEITVNDNPVLSFNPVQNVLCNGESNGSATAVSTG